MDYTINAPFKVLSGPETRLLVGSDFQKLCKAVCDEWTCREMLSPDEFVFMMAPTYQDFDGFVQSCGY